MSRFSSGPGLSKYRPEDPKIGFWVIVFVALSFLALCICDGMSRAESTPDLVPIINDIRHRVTPSDRKVTTPTRHGSVSDGPMCQPPPKWDGPWPTHAAVLAMEPATPEESLEVSRQLNSCSRGRTVMADPFLVLALYRYEADLGVPQEIRGILGAIWCFESAFRTRSSRTGGPIRGDWEGGWSGAHGPLQLHSWAQDTDKCGLMPPPGCRKNDCFQEGGRDDLFASAACWWHRILVRKDSQYVRSLKCRNPWPLSEALVSNSGKYASLGCNAKSGHWRELMRWRKK